MFLKFNFFRLVSALLLVFSTSVLTFADTIRLKDGSIIKGKIVSFGDGKFTVLIGEGSRQRQMFFFADEVESIQFDGTSGINIVKTSLPTRSDSNKTTIGQTETTKTNPQPTPSKSVIVTDNTNQSRPDDPTGSIQTNQNTTVVTNQPTKPKPLVLNVKVLADNTANGWTNSQWVVKKGQKIRISGKGQVNLGNGRFSPPSGISSLPDKDKLIPQEATGALIAVIGDDNNDFIFIGASREFIAQRDGALFLGVNEGNLNDNSGAFDVTIEIEPN
jgi:hypothetical protein